MLQTRKMYYKLPRPTGQAIADEEQRPVVVLEGYGSANLPLKPVRVIQRFRPTYHTIEDVKKRNKAAGGHWFDPDTMRCFSSRVQSRIYVAKDGRAFFVSSERAPEGWRRYSVRVANMDGTIHTYGERAAYETGRAAHAAARKAAGA